MYKECIKRIYFFAGQSNDKFVLVFLGDNRLQNPQDNTV